MKRCRVSGNQLTEVVSFGRQPLGNGFIREDEYEDEYFYDMRVGFEEECCLFQLIEQPNPAKMFHEEYAFFSSTSNNMKLHFKEWSANMQSDVTSPNPFLVEIGCNDGIFLQNFIRKGWRCLGVEPSKNVAEEARKKEIPVLNSFISEKIAAEIVSEHGKADYVSAANVICHIPNILDLAKAVDILLSDTGLFVFEEPYLGDVVQKCSYDQIYDEHVFLFSCISVRHLFRRVGLELIDAEPQATHGGSMRYTIGREGYHHVKDRVKRLLDHELFECDHVMDLASADTSYRRRSIAELQRIVDLTRVLKRYFPQTEKPLIVVNVGGFSVNKFITPAERSYLYELVADSLSQVDASGVEIVPQTMPPFPWHFGGQRFHNLFVNSQEIVNFCENYGYRICLDTSHSKLASNYNHNSFTQFVHDVSPFIAHLHLVDARGTHDEGLQINEGEIDFAKLCHDLDVLAPHVPFIPEIWQGHKNKGEAFWLALDRLDTIWKESN